METKKNPGGHPGPETSSSNNSNLPEQFWKRDTHDHIRQAAWSRGRSADVVFYATLARLAAMVSPHARLDAGLGPGSLNLFVAIVGKSSSGKSTGTAVARELIAVPPYLTQAGKFRDGIGVGTGEGLAEAYMGYETRENFDLKPDGKPAKAEKVRAQVRENVFVYIDEGQSLTQMVSRTGATIGPTLRSAWAGELLGQANAREETTRHLPAGSYALGMVIGYQPETAQPLLADAAPGTPQRFLWATATDPHVPQEQPRHPGPLRIDLTWSSGLAGSPWTGVIGYADAIRRELWERNLARVRGETADDNELDAHASFMWCKVAALLAILDGRWNVDEEDWKLAKMVWDTSCAVRDDLVAWGKEKQRADAENRHSYAQVRETRLREAKDGYQDQQVARVARLVALRVHGAHEAQSKGALNRALSSSQRKYLDDAIIVARESGWIEARTGGGDGTFSLYVPGRSAPAS